MKTPRVASINDIDLRLAALRLNGLAFFPSASQACLTAEAGELHRARA